MSENILKSVLEEKYSKEFEIYSNAPNHFFSIRHKRNMKKIFTNSSISKNTPSSPKTLQLKFNKRFVTVAVIIVLLTVFSITAVAIAIAGFLSKEHSDNTELFAINYENAPTQIEEIYYLSELPVGFEVYSSTQNSESIITTYYNQSDNKYIIFSQHIKETFNAHIDNEQGKITDTVINGYVGLYYANNAGLNILLWDDKDYIFKISSELSKNDTEKLAKTTKMQKYQ